MFRFLLTRGDTLGGSMRNLGGVLAQQKLTRSIIAHLKNVLPVDKEIGGYNVTPLARVLMATGAFGDIIAAGNIDHTGPRPAAPPPGISQAYGAYLVNTPPAVAHVMAPISRARNLPIPTRFSLPTSRPAAPSGRPRPPSSPRCARATARLCPLRTSAA